MAINAANAASAYLQAAGRGLGPGLDAPPQAGRGEFAELVKGALGDAAQVMKHGEEMSLKAAFGEAQMTDVITAVTAAEVTLQTVVAVRDKLIEAYQMILRMPM